MGYLWVFIGPCHSKTDLVPFSPYHPYPTKFSWMKAAVSFHWCLIYDALIGWSDCVGFQLCTDWMVKSCRLSIDCPTTVAGMLYCQIYFEYLYIHRFIYKLIVDDFLIDFLCVSTQAVVERDEEIKRTREEALRTQQNLEEQLAEERGSTQENQVNGAQHGVDLSINHKYW